MASRIAFKSAKLLLVGVLAASVTSPVLAQSSVRAQALLDNKFVVNLGGFVVNSDVTASLNGQSTQNPEINFDETFGKDNNATRFRADALWRITPTHHLRLMYFNNNRNAARAVDRDIQWGDYTFALGTTVASEYKTQTTALSYEYAFMRQPSYEVVANVGVHYSKITLKLSGNASVNGTPVGATTREDTLSAPLPLIGVRAGWVVSPQWYIDAQAQLFGVNVNGYDGHWSDLRFGATWMFSNNFGLGLGYDRFASNVDVDKGSFKGTANVGYSGLLLYLTGTF